MKARARRYVVSRAQPLTEVAGGIRDSGRKQGIRLDKAMICDAENGNVRASGNMGKEPGDSIIDVYEKPLRPLAHQP